MTSKKKVMQAEQAKERAKEEARQAKERAKEEARLQKEREERERQEQDGAAEGPVNIRAADVPWFKGKAHAVKLGKKYPMMKNAPLEARRNIARRALFTVEIFGPLAVFGFLFMPRYLGYMFQIVDLEAQTNLYLQWLEATAVMVAPLLVMGPLLSRVLMPYSIRKTMIKAGFDPNGGARGD